MKKVSEHIYLLDTYALGFPEFVAAYLLIGSRGAALVDIGYASSSPMLIEGLRKAGLKPSDVDYVIPTHLHLDHAGGTSQFIKASRKSIVLCHPRAVRHFLDPSKLNASVREIYGEAASLFGPVEPIQLNNIRSVQEYERIDLGDVSLRFIYAPGHAPHQIAVYVEEDQALITGDAVSIDCPSIPLRFPTTPPPSYDHIEAIETLRKLSRLKSEIILRPHFGGKTWSPDYFDEEISLLESWKDRVKKSIDGGLAVDEAVEEIISERVERLRGEVAIPFHLYTTVRISYLGMKKYLEENR